MLWSGSGTFLNLVRANCATAAIDKSGMVDYLPNRRFFFAVITTTAACPALFEGWT
jgi:hypothetical protein